MKDLEAEIVVAALYKFTPLRDLDQIKSCLVDAARLANTCGTLLIAPEGINGTIAGSRDGVDAVLDAIRGLPDCADIHHKESNASAPPFGRMKVRIKREIVTMGVPDINPTELTGDYVSPAAWNELIADPDVIVVDTRNDYEVAIGTFEGAVNPGTSSFRELPEWIAQNLDSNTHTKVAMFCTGGIRCEKSTALLKSRGFKSVYHLEGGILKYLEETSAEESMWKGACFVFDERVSLTHGLEFGGHVACPDCGRPHEKESSCTACSGRDAPARSSTASHSG